MNETPPLWIAIPFAAVLGLFVAAILLCAAAIAVGLLREALDALIGAIRSWRP